MPKTSVKQPVKKAAVLQNNNPFAKIEGEIKSNQSKVSMVLGALILLIIGILIYNYFSKPKPALGPAQQTGQQTTQADASVDSLPGKYTVKEGDTLFEIADKYYKDGYKFSEIAKINNLSNPDIIEKGQVLDIPKLDVQTTLLPSPTDVNITQDFGPKIDGSSYTVVENDWLSKISARAYGDIKSYDKIAAANNIPNPNLIEPGQVLTIPR